MLLTQLFHIGSNILPTYTLSPPASPAQSSGYSGNICLFLVFSNSRWLCQHQHLPALLMKSEVQEELQFSLNLTVPVSWHDFMIILYLFNHLLYAQECLWYL